MWGNTGSFRTARGLDRLGKSHVNEEMKDIISAFRLSE
jgi:hypothetical protein